MRRRGERLPAERSSARTTSHASSSASKPARPASRQLASSPASRRARQVLQSGIYPGLRALFSAQQFFLVLRVSSRSLVAAVSMTFPPPAGLKKSRTF
jgi:hypothetical protein